MKWLPQQPLTVKGDPASKAFLEYLQALNTDPAAPTWGAIGGTLADQLDLQAAIDAKLSRSFTYAASQATTSGSAFDFTGVPAAVSEIVLDLTGVSLNGTDNLLIQLGVSGGPVTSGYAANTSISTGSSQYLTTGYPVAIGGAALAVSGRIRFERIENNDWTGSFICNYGVAGATYGSGRVTLSGELTQVRLTRTGANTFDAGSARLGWR